MNILYFLESIRMPGLNEFMLAITRLGEETAFLVAALIVFWCVDKRKGYYVMAVGFAGTMANQFLKLVCRVPRPWVLDPNFTILEQAREAADGYSFPSGHSQSAVGTFGAIAAASKNKWVKGVCIALCVLVPLSRMYLGVHTPADVLVGAGMALVLVWLLRRWMLEGDRGMLVLIPLLTAMAVGLLLYTTCWPFPADVDQENLASGVKNAYTLLGCMLGIAVVYPVEKKYVNFSAKACWWAQILKVVLGLAVVLLVKEGLRAPLDWVFGGRMAARMVRYFLVVLTAGILWPMSFGWFSRLGRKSNG
ncbi:MAG: phosphatase PAP2 family protein [Candidatus Faecousia sp.]|nr:phosphatase PAP2 family protein [Candidatus Faecousia sp.]